MNTQPIYIEHRGSMLAATIPARTRDIPVLAVPWAPGAEGPLRATARAILRSTNVCHSSDIADLGPVHLSRREDRTRWRVPRLSIHRHAVALGWHNTSYVATW